MPMPTPKPTPMPMPKPKPMPMPKPMPTPKPMPMPTPMPMAWPVPSFAASCYAAGVGPERASARPMTEPTDEDAPAPDSAPDETHHESTERRAKYEKQLARGTLVNAAGLAGKLVYPLLIVVFTKLFGAEVMGTYLLGLTVAEIGSSLVATGWMDAATLFASPHAEAAEQGGSRAPMNQVVGRALGYAVWLALILAGLVQLGGAALIGAVFPEYGALLPGVYAVAWALVPMAFAQVVTSAAKAHMAMEWDALLNGLRPTLLFVAGVVAWAMDTGLTGLFVSYAVAMVGLALFACIPLKRLFDAREVVRTALRPGLDRGMIAFAIPQGLNHTFSLYITRLDTIMLAAFGFDPALLGWYATAAFLTSNLQQVRIVFSTALAPLVARHHQRGEATDLTALLSKVSRWTATLAISIVIPFVVLRDDLMGLIDERYAGGQSAFVVVLVVAPLMSCLLGLAGNFVAYTGHSRWNLANSLLVAFLNTGLNLWLIPRFGLMGAAIATATSASLVILLQVVELWKLEGVVVRLQAVWQPWLALAAMAVAFAFLWDPAFRFDLGMRVGVGLGLTVGFVGLMFVLGHPEIRRRRAGSLAPKP